MDAEDVEEARRDGYHNGYLLAFGFFALFALDRYLLHLFVVNVDTMIGSGLLLFGWMSLAFRRK